MKNFGTIALLTITLFQLSNFEPVKADIGRDADDKMKTCIETCQAFIDQPGWEIRACVTDCQKRYGR